MAAPDCWMLGAVCLERKLDVGNFILAIFGLIGLAGIFVAYRQFRLTRRVQQTQSAIQLFNTFMGDKERRDFIYRLDYSLGPRGWKFNPSEFPNSEEERHLDHILYQFSFIGSLLNGRDLTNADLSWIKPEVGIVLNNLQVLDYLEWLKSPNQLPNHTGFSGAIRLYRTLYGETSQYKRLKKYLHSSSRSSLITRLTRSDVLSGKKHILT
jgi:hypothetical protein